MKVVCFFVLTIILTSCEKNIFQGNTSDPQYVFESFWHELDRNYSFFSYTNLNWDSVYTANKHKVTGNTPDKELFQILTNILDLLGDGHSNVYSQFGAGGNINYFEKYPINLMYINEDDFEYYTVLNKIYEFGKLKLANIGYIRIKTFDGKHDNFEAIDTILSTFESTNGLIIDVRSNRGGYISNSEIVISRLTDAQRTACRYRTRNGVNHNDFSPWVDVVIAPAIKGTKYSKPVAILTNRQSYSATEWFVLFADALPNVTIVGDTTGGGSAKTIHRELSNGWILRTSNTQTLTPKGLDYQFTGIYPDVPVWITPQDAAKNIDTILEKAVSILRN